MSDDSSLLGWLKLARCRGLAPADPARLVALVGSAEPFGHVAAPSFREAGLSEESSRHLASRALHDAACRELAGARERGETILSVQDRSYPAGLKALAVPPPVLTVAGDLSAISTPLAAVAVVGSRRPSGYGLAMTDTLVRPLAELGIVVVSGLATGIDARAHRAALEEGGRTIAVLGTGIDRVYPKGHAGLSSEIARSGALVTEFPPGTPPLPHHFPRRNRIVVGLSLACVVVEGAERSGSLVTARWAQEEGRPLLAVPGRVGDRLSGGPLSLLRDGAALARTADDVLEELPPALRPEQALPAQERADAHRSEAQARLAECKKSCRGADEILALLPAHDPVHVDDLIERSGIGAREVLETLFSLELRALIESVPGGSVQRSASGRALL